MLLEIDESKTIADIQDRFSLCFPYLKIEFYRKPHHWGESTSTKDLVAPQTYIRDIRKVRLPGILEIKSTYKTGEVEQLFKKFFGLNVQIFRLENNQWRETTKSDNLKLNMQAQISTKKKDSLPGHDANSH